MFQFEITNFKFAYFKLISNCKFKISNSSRGFTLFEVVVVLFLLASLVSVVIGTFVAFQKKSVLDASIEEFAVTLRLAQNKTLSSESNSQYGVYFNATTNPDRYVLFKGTSYATRDSASDRIYVLPSTLEFSSISLGGGSEIVFEKITGFALQSGSASQRLIADVSQAKTVYIASSGVIDFTAFATPSDSARVKDSRHVHIDYSRVINTATENVVLTFDNTIVQTFPIATNMSAGQFYWQGTITAGGSPQTVTVQTHRLNNSDTQFSIHRDRSMNNKTLTMTLSGDNSGNLANYSSDGATVTHSSIYVSNLAWQ